MKAEKFQLIDTENNRVISSGVTYSRLFNIMYNLTTILMDDYLENHPDDFCDEEFDKLIYRYKLVSL